MTTKASVIRGTRNAAIQGVAIIADHAVEPPGSCLWRLEDKLPPGIYRI
jgi:hypothetical protein